MLLLAERRSTHSGFLLWLIFVMLGSAGPSFAVGEPVNGFPNWYERMVHVLTNRARCDPAAALVDCSPCGDVDLGCYDPVPPLQWDENLNRAARFHTANLTDAGCGMMHDSPCQLDPAIGSTYPDLCDGSVSCACSGGAASCVGGTGVWDRLALFGVSGARGENIAWRMNDPIATVDMWLLEPMTSSLCGFHCVDYNDCNGHRYNILNGSTTRMGAGADGNYVVQDFGGVGDIDQKIPSAAHYPEGGGPATEFWVNWYDSAPPNEARVNIDGQCFPMTLERGSGDNGSYLYTTETSGCSRYYFEFSDSNDQPVVYPETGSFGIGCADWESTRPDPCSASAVGESTPHFRSLKQNYPNPFNPQTTIAFELPERGAISLRIFDVVGRLVRVLVDGEIYDRGSHAAVWNGRDDTGRQTSSGTYFYRLEAGEFTETKRMVLLK